MQRLRVWVCRVWALLFASLAGSSTVGCRPKADKDLFDRPELGRLSLLATVSVQPGLVISSVAGRPGCRLLVGTDGGVLYTVDGTYTPIGRKIAPRGALFLSGQPTGGHIAAWTDSPLWLGVIRDSPFEVDSIKVPGHPWGGRRAGPAIAQSDGVILAPLTHPGFAQRSPESTATVRLAYKVDRSGAIMHELGPVLQTAGPSYATWRNTRGALKLAGDTLLVVRFGDGIVSRYLGATTEAIQTIELPRYVIIRRPRTEVLRFPWIQVGDLPYFMDAPQVVAASFSSSGHLYAIRPYDYTWSPRPNPYVRDAGAWNLTSYGIEVYDEKGDRMAAFRAPEGAREIVAGADGLLLVVAGGELLVFQDPVGPATKCTFGNVSLAPETSSGVGKGETPEMGG